MRAESFMEIGNNHPFGINPIKKQPFELLSLIMEEWKNSCKLQATSFKSMNCLAIQVFVADSNKLATDLQLVACSLKLEACSLNKPH